MAQPPETAAAILAASAARGIPLEPFGPVWSSARLRLSRAGWQGADLEPFLSFTVPYASTSGGRLSQDAVRLALTAFAGRDALRILEIGSGSGIFARLFLDALKQASPKTYATCHYLVTDGSDTILAAQRHHGILADHDTVVSQRVLDVDQDWPDLGRFDLILSSYVMDSLPFDFLAVNDTRTWRREMRAVLDDTRKDQAGPLADALASGDPAALVPFVRLGPLLSLQTRHVPIDRADLAHGQTLPTDTGGVTLPFVHSCGPLACIDRALATLAPGGLLVFSDYGHLVPYTAHEQPEFQGYGTSVAAGINFPQIDAACAGLPGITLFKPEEEEGHLYTRVLQRGPAADLGPLVDELYGAIRHRALTAPIDAARDYLRPRMYELARGMYAKALRLQPQSWVLMQEIALSLLLANDEAAAALDMADLGLAQNPLAPDLWRARALALLALDRLDDAHQAALRAVTLSPGNASAQRARARIALRQNRPAEALAAIATAFAHDAEGDARDALLALQGEALTAIGRDELARLMASANPFRALDDLPKG